MEVLLQYLDEIDDAWFYLTFLASRPRSGVYGVLVAGFILASCGTIV